MNPDLFLAVALHLASKGERPAQQPTQAAIITSAGTVPPRWQAFARCVVRRESNGQPHVVNAGSGAAGLYQFMPAWNRGLPYIVRDRLVRFGMPKGKASDIRKSLSAKPIQAWRPIYQTIGFIEVVERGGQHHWDGGNYAC